jgi:hypothetical protein
MPRERELMERLAAADPLRDAEQLTAEDQREADALLARLLAGPVAPAAEPRRPRSRLRRRALAVAGAACAAVAALAAIDLVDPDTPGSHVVDRAVAAVTRAGVVYHVLEFTTASAPSLPEAALRAPQTALIESWYTSDGRLHRKVFAVREGQKGRLVEDFAGRQHPDRTSGSALLWDPSYNTISESGWGSIDTDVPYLDSFADPGAQLRALQEQGRLRVAGTTSLDGNRAYRLVSDKSTVLGEEVEVEYTVDAESYLPLSRRVSAERGGEPTQEVVTRYRSYERLALDDATGRLLALDPHPDAKCSEFAHELTEERDLGFPNPCTAGGKAQGRNR